MDDHQRFPGPPVSFARTRYRAEAWLALVVCLLVGPGCSLTETIVQRASHWHENRADDLLCPSPPVTLQPPQGYLVQGATFAGADITGPPGKSAIDAVLELKDELQRAKDEQEELRQQLQLAQATIEQQGVAIDTASKELQHAMDDYARMRDTLSQWYADLRDLDRDYHHNQDAQDESLEDLEHEIKAMIDQCESAMADASDPPYDDGVSDEAPAVSLDAHQSPAPIVEVQRP